MQPDRPTLVEPAAQGHELRAFVRGLKLIFSVARGPATAQLIVGIAVAIGPAMVVLLIGRILGALSSHRPVWSELVQLLVISALSQGLASLQPLLERISRNRLAEEVEVRVMTAVGSRIGLAHFEDTDALDRLARAGAAGDAADVALRTFVSVPRSLARAISFGVLATRISWWAPWAMVANAMPGSIVEWRHARRQNETAERVQQAERRAFYHYGLSTTLSAAKESRVFGLSEWLLGRHEHAWREAMKPSWATRRARTYAAIPPAIMRIVLGAGPALYAFWLTHAGRLDAAGLISGLLALNGVGGPSYTLANLPGRLREAAHPFGALFRILDPIAERGGSQIPGPEPSTGIRFEKVTFAYPGHRPVLNGVDLEFPAGAAVALVGVNGAGKSTMVKLLCRFYEPDEGRITWDGQDIREYEPDELRRRMAVVFQDVVAYPFTASENIGFDDLDGIEDAAQEAGIRDVLDEIGWTTPLSPTFGGAQLSTGQWQRIALARAIHRMRRHSASVLILDEPTAALDVRIEQELYERFAELTRGRTTVLVSHRFSTVRMADTIALLDHGRITEHGSHQQLMASDTQYRQLFELQAARFRSNH